MPETVRCDLVDGVATVTLQRPEALNALDTALKTDLRDLLREVGDDPAVRAVVLTGSGRAFCVGQDLAEHADNLQTQPLDQVWSTVPDHYTPIVLSLATMPKPVVAAVNGVAAGAGAAFAMACDFRIVGSSAGFNMAFSAIGLAADSGSTWTLPRLVGMGRAKELLLTPSTVPAERALELGLATQVVDDDAVLPTARELALRLAAGPTAAYGAIRRELAYAAGHTLADTLEFEARAMAETGGTADHRNAVRSFLAKQRPTFEGS